MFLPRVRREFLDQDYLKSLSPQELAWLNKFMGEYYGANLDFKNLKNNLHKTKKLKKDCTDRNNKQNNDLYGVTKTNGLLKTISSYEEDDFVGNPDILELALSGKIDKQKLK